MSDKKRKIFFYALLVAAVAYGLYFYIPRWTTDDRKTGSERPSAAGLASLPVPESIESTSVSESNTAIDIDAERDKRWGTDPFRSRKRSKVPTKLIQASSPSFTLSGIVYGGDQPLAIVNSRGVSEGDIVDGATVIKIERQQVILRHQGKRISLQVNKG